MAAQEEVSREDSKPVVEEGVTQNAKLIDYLQTHSEGVTIFSAMFELGIGCLHKRLSEISPKVAKLGYIIEDEWEKTPGGARVVRHRLTRINYG